ncbi:AAA family ATPase [Paraburkholderia caribensis]|nr:AAA family ATPase [Paraburkholderia caribensis]
MEGLSGDFHALAERVDILVKVQERLRKLFRRDLLVEWDGGALMPKFARLDLDSQPYVSSREASGLLHLVGMLAALYDDEVGVLCIDEPEVSLHPQLQAFLLAEMLRVAGVPEAGNNKKVIVIATHSTEMVQIAKAEDLLSLVFCYDREREPVQIPAGAGELKGKKIQGLVSRLGQEHKLALFSRRPLLVEGPSDVIICSALARKMDSNLEAAGSQLLPVIGKGQMPVVAKLFRMMGKEPVVLADADGLADSFELASNFLQDNKLANAKAVSMGSDSALTLAKTIYNDFCALVIAQWQAVADHAERHPYWVNRTEKDDIETTKRRAFFSSLFELDDKTIASFDQSGKIGDMKKRLVTLLELFELAGCFILRKGSIESYYTTADQFTTQEKPTAAADEAEHIDLVDTGEVSTAYADVIRCITFAANAAQIREAESLREMLVGAIAPAFIKFCEGASDHDIAGTARFVLGERAKLFQMKVVDGKLWIDLKSNVLEVKGFPIVLDKTDNVIEKLTKAVR